MDGWIKLHRKMKKWEWYGEPNTTLLFIHLLLSATHTKAKWRGVDLESGQVYTGRKILADETGLTEQKVRTALSNLKSTNEITIRSTKKYSIISIVKWSEYQVSNQVPNQEVTNNQPAKQPTDNHIQECKEEKNIYTDDFLTFWRQFPKQRAGSKERAAKAFEKALKRTTVDKIINSVESYAGSKEVAEGYAKGAAAWLNDDRFNNQYEPTTKRKTVYQEL